MCLHFMYRLLAWQVWLWMGVERWVRETFACTSVKCKERKGFGGWGWGEGGWQQVLFRGTVAEGVDVVESAVRKEDESKKGNCDQAAERLVTPRSLLPTVSNERGWNYLRRGGLVPHNWWSRKKNELHLKLFLFKKGLCDDFLCTQEYVAVGILSVSPATEQGHHLVWGLSGFD